MSSCSVSILDIPERTDELSTRQYYRSPLNRKNVKINYNKTYEVIKTNFHEKIFSTPKDRYEKKTVCLYHICMISGER